MAKLVIQAQVGVTQVMVAAMAAMAAHLLLPVVVVELAVTQATAVAKAPLAMVAAAAAAVLAMQPATLVLAVAAVVLDCLVKAQVGLRVHRVVKTLVEAVGQVVRVLPGPMEATVLTALPKVVTAAIMAADEDKIHQAILGPTTALEVGQSASFGRATVEHSLQRTQVTCDGS